MWGCIGKDKDLRSVILIGRSGVGSGVFNDFILVYLLFGIGVKKGF